VSEIYIRRALIGARVAVPSGEVGLVTGIDVGGLARVVIGNGHYVDIDQSGLELVRLERGPVENRDPGAKPSRSYNPDSDN
jgi:hypothetical protein